MISMFLITSDNLNPKHIYSYRKEKWFLFVLFIKKMELTAGIEPATSTLPM